MRQVVGAASSVQRRRVVHYLPVHHIAKRRHPTVAVRLALLAGDQVDDREEQHKDDHIGELREDEGCACEGEAPRHSDRLVPPEPWNEFDGDLGYGSVQEDRVLFARCYRLLDR